MDPKEKERLKREIEEILEAGSLEQIPVKEPAPQSIGAPAPAKRSWWWVELWREERPLFKHFVRDGLYFVGTLGILEGAHRLLETSTLNQGEQWWLSKVHFWTYIVALGIFGFRFIIILLRLPLSRRS